MKLTWTIAFFCLLAVTVTGQTPQTKQSPCASAKTQRSEPCALFRCMASSGAHEAAYGMMLRDEVLSCTTADDLYYKAQVLASNRKTEQAIQAIEELFAKFPDDGRYAPTLRRLLKLKHLQENPLPLELILPEGLNTGNDMMPAWVSSQGLVALSQVQEYHSHFPYSRKGEPRYELMQIALPNAAGPNPTSERINAEGFAQIGPGCMVGDEVLYFTAVPKVPFQKQSEAGKLKLYSLDLQKPKARPQALSFVQEGANDAFPVFVPSRNTLIFSSDRAGGYGGMDLWQTTLHDGRWSPPEPLTNGANTPGDELFPEVVGDTLFFSSNRKDQGLGGMDIYGYCFTNDSLWNLGSPINTPYDDFRLVFTAEGEAAMASNRPTVTGGDNIYHLRWAKKEQFFNQIKGKIESGGAAAGQKVELIDRATGAVQTSVVERDGSFGFHHVKGQSNFEVRFPDLDLQEGDRLQLYTAEGAVLQDLVADGTNKGFLFVLLAPHDYHLEKLNVQDAGILSVDIMGMLSASNEPNVSQHMQIVLLDSEGEVIGTTTAGADGRFRFESVRPDGAYVIKCEGLNTGADIHILDSRGEVKRSIAADESNQFVYVRLDANEKVITLTNELQQRVRISERDIFDIGIVYFGYNEFEIDESGANSLLKIAEIMKANAHLEIELSGHTDSHGSDLYNLQLSELRIDAVIRFLIAAGVEASRLSGTGFGERMLRNRCADNVDCTEEEHAENRRTEFRIRERSSGLQGQK